MSVYLKKKNLSFYNFILRVKISSQDLFFVYINLIKRKYKKKLYFNFLRQTSEK